MASRTDGTGGLGAGDTPVKPSRFEYFAPESLAEAVALRDAHPGAAVLAGGQSLLPIMNFRLGRPEQVIDLRKASELAFVRVQNDVVEVGAMTRQRDLERDEGAARANPLIAESLRLVAHAVIRNRGTVGGSIAHADPAAELPALLSCLDGSVEVAGVRGRRRISAGELFVFHLTTSLEPNEVITSVSFPALEPSWGWSFLEVTRRHGDFALAGVCAALKLDGDRCVGQVRLAACGIGTTPVRLSTAEEALLSRPLTEKALREAGRAAAGYVTAGDETQASTAYRRQLVEALVRRSLLRAAARLERRTS